MANQAGVQPDYYYVVVAEFTVSDVIVEESIMVTLDQAQAQRCADTYESNKPNFRPSTIIYVYRIKFGTCTYGRIGNEGELVSNRVPKPKYHIVWSEASRKALVTSIKRTYKHLDSTDHLSKDAIDYVIDVLSGLVNRLVDLMKAAPNPVLEFRPLIEQLITTDQLRKQAICETDKAVMKPSARNFPKEFPESRQAMAPFTKPKLLDEFCIRLSAVLEYISAEVMELGSWPATEAHDGQSEVVTIKAENIKTGIRNDEELSIVLRQYV